MFSHSQFSVQTFNTISGSAPVWNRIITMCEHGKKKKKKKTTGTDLNPIPLFSRSKFSERTLYMVFGSAPVWNRIISVCAHGKHFLPNTGTDLNPIPLFSRSQFSEQTLYMVFGSAPVWNRIISVSAQNLKNAPKQAWALPLFGRTKVLHCYLLFYSPRPSSHFVVVVVVVLFCFVFVFCFVVVLVFGLLCFLWLLGNNLPSCHRKCLCNSHFVYR